MQVATFRKLYGKFVRQFSNFRLKKLSIQFQKIKL